MISTHVAAFYLNEIKSTPYYKHKLKKHLNMIMPELEKAERQEIEQLYESVEEVTVNYVDYTTDFLDTIAKVPVWNRTELTAIIEAYLIAPDRILGITKQVLKQ